jgi:ribosome maturation factor RimP
MDKGRSTMGSSASLVQQITNHAERVASSEGLEVVEVVLRGSGSARLLRITIDKPEGVTLEDCETLSRQLGTILDVEEVIPGGRYQLEVTSPGIERKLFRPQDFERFTGSRIRVSLRKPIDGKKTLEGQLQSYAGDTISLAVSEDLTVSIPRADVVMANLKHDWGQPQKR